MRNKTGLSIEALAAKAGIHANYLGSLERCQKVPTIGVVESLADALGTDPAALLDRFEAMSESELRKLAAERLKRMSSDELKAVLRILDAVRF
jgi:transcriptional regulator with XRE-family HTH domain